MNLENLRNRLQYLAEELVSQNRITAELLERVRPTPTSCEKAQESPKPLGLMEEIYYALEYISVQAERHGALNRDLESLVIESDPINEKVYYEQPTEVNSKSTRY